MNDKPTMYYHLEGYSEVGRAIGTFGLALEPIRRSSPRDILEVGPYNGIVSRELLYIFPKARLTTVEFSEDHFRQEKPMSSLDMIFKDSITAIQGDGFYPISKLGMPPNSYDAIFAMNNIWQTIGYSNLRAENYEGIFSEWKDLLRDGGWLASSWKTDSLVFQKNHGAFHLAHKDAQMYTSVADMIMEASRCEVIGDQKNLNLNAGLIGVLVEDIKHKLKD